MFADLNGTWLDGAFFTVLGYVDGMHTFFMTQVHILAKICFALSFGISCIKLAMGATEVNKVLTQAFMSVVTYFIMIFVFPHIMINMQKIVSEMSHAAVFSQGFSANLEGMRGKEDKYYQYLNKIGTDSKGNTIWTVKGEKGDARKALNLQITHKETGLISLNKVFQMIIATFKAMWQSLNIGNAWDFFKHIPDFLMIIVIGLGYIYTLSVAIGQYVMVVMHYTYLYGMGVLFIPLMLWEGTKHAFEKLCGSIFNIGVRLLVVQSTLYLVVMVNIDILKNMFILSDGSIDFLQGLEFYLSVAFMVVFIQLLIDKVPAIAEFLCGGQPKIDFAGFKPTISGSIKGRLGQHKGGPTDKEPSPAGVLSMAGAAVRMGFNMEKAHGGGSGPGAGQGSLVKSVGQSAKQGGANAMDKKIAALPGAPQPAKDQGQSAARGANPASGSAGASAPASASAPAGKNGGQGGTGPGAAESKSLKKSSNTSETEKAKGMSEQYQEKGAAGGNHSGPDGRLKALKSSVGEIPHDKQQAAPDAPATPGGDGASDAPAAPDAGAAPVAVGGS